MNYKHCTLHIKKECEHGGERGCPCSQYNDSRIWDKEPTINELTNAEYECFAQCHYDSTHNDK
jgi:hypothetical protein